MRHHLSIDIETKSSIDIGKAGLYKYAQSPDFAILLFAYKWDDDPVQIVDLATGELIPDWILDELVDPDTIKHAYNAAFEWYCLNRAGAVAMYYDARSVLRIYSRSGRNRKSNRTAAG